MIMADTDRKLWRVERTDDVGYDEDKACIILAASEKEVLDCIRVPENGLIYFEENPIMVSEIDISSGEFPRVLLVEHIGG